MGLTSDATYGQVNSDWRRMSGKKGKATPACLGPGEDASRKTKENPHRRIGRTCDSGGGRGVWERHSKSRSCVLIGFQRKFERKRHAGREVVKNNKKFELLSTIRLLRKRVRRPGHGLTGTRKRKRTTASIQASLGGGGCV